MDRSAVVEPFFLTPPSADGPFAMGGGDEAEVSFAFTEISAVELFLARSERSVCKDDFLVIGRSIGGGGSRSSKKLGMSNAAWLGLRGSV